MIQTHCFEPIGTQCHFFFCLLFFCPLFFCPLPPRIHCTEHRTLIGHNRRIMGHSPKPFIVTFASDKTTECHTTHRHSHTLYIRLCHVSKARNDSCFLCGSLIVLTWHDVTIRHALSTQLNRWWHSAMADFDTRNDDKSGENSQAACVHTMFHIIAPGCQRGLCQRMFFLGTVHIFYGRAHHKGMRKK